jgi:hypothetical protein
MAEQIIQVPPDAGGKKVRTQEVVAGGNIVEMETVVLGDPSTVGNLAGVTASGALKTDASATTQPISGTVTAIQATGANLHANIDNFPATQPVSGTVSVTNFANPLPVSESGTWTVQPGNTANTTPWLATINQGGTSAAVTGANALKVDGSAVTQPVSGSIAVNNFPATQAVSGTVGVNNFPATQAVSVASLPLPANSAQESNGNLALLVNQTRNDAQILDVLNAILAQLKLLNFNYASNSTSAHIDSDTWLMDTLPTTHS